MPQRIQRQRTKGWKAPPDAIYVGRPSVWGNPFAWTGTDGKADRARAVQQYRTALNYGDGYSALLHYMHEHGWHGALDLHLVRTYLRGHDLMCWCRPADPCHADVLLEIANA